MRGKYSRSQHIESKLALFRCREEGMSVSKICQLFGMSRTTYYKWPKRAEMAIKGLGRIAAWQSLYPAAPNCSSKKKGYSPRRAGRHVSARTSLRPTPPK